MELTGIEFCRLGGYNYNPNLIERLKDTKPQYKLSKNERIKNLSNAFKVNKDKLMDGTILLIDDICTSGATFESIILELHKQGINDITCFATSSPCS